MNTAQAIIIGGGVMGASCAFQLARRGMKDVVLLEKRFLAAGGTGKSTALVRMHYDDYPEAKMVFESAKIFNNWREFVGGDCGLVKTGFIRLVLPEESASLKANVRMQQEIGIRAQVVTPQELQALEPHWNFGNIEAAAYEPDSGYADPQATTLGFAEAAKRLGVQILQDTVVTAIPVSDSRVLGVHTNRGDISAPIVLIAAGPWSVNLCKPLGIDLPIRAERHQLATFRRPPQLAGPHMCCIDSTLEMYFKPEGRDMTIVGSGVGQKGADPDNYTEGVDQSNIAFAAERIAKRIPGMEAALSMGGWAGIYDVTPDEKMIFDRLPYEGLYICAGHSGTGFKLAPAVGLLFSELICDGKTTTMDISPFRASRFAEGKPLIGEHSYSSRWYTLSEEIGG